MRQTEEKFMTWLALTEKDVERATFKWRMWRRNSRPMSLPTDGEIEDFKHGYAERMAPSEPESESEE